jgi:ATP-dependent helicase/nuclease subunit A
MQFTREQQRAIETMAHVICIDAGAGSGKTRVLIERIVHLLETPGAWQDGRPDLDGIAAITFTEKAAGEMRTRLRQACRRRAAQPGIDPGTQSRWREFERRAETARISTIHAFCSLLLRENALRLGLDPDFAVLADAEAALLMDETVREAFQQLLSRGEDAAERLATAFPVPRIEKTLQKMIRQANLIGRIGNSHPLDDPGGLLREWRGLLLREHDRRLRRLPLDPSLRAFIRELGAYEGAACRESAGREKFRQLLLDGLCGIAGGAAPAEIDAFAEQALGFKVSDRKTNWESEAVYDRLKKLQDHVKAWLKEVTAKPAEDSDLDEESAELTCDLMAVCRAVQKAYAQAMQERNAIDFEAQIAGALAALRENEAIRMRTAQRIRFLLIDEFQDTDAIQLEIARLLCDTPGGPDLFIVGDAKQSIYYFRGAEVEVFQQEREQADERLPLNRNFRSLPGVMNFINGFFAESGLLRAVTEDAAMDTHREAAGMARVEALVSPCCKLVENYRQQESGLIAARIAQLCDPESGITVFDSPGSGFRTAEYGDIALLFRARSNIYLYEEALRRAGIPYMPGSGTGFYELQEINDILNLIKTVIDPFDSLALAGFLRGPMGRLNDDALFRLAAAAPLPEAFAAESIPEGFPMPEALREARDLVRTLRRHQYEPVPAFLYRLLDRTGFEAILLSQFLGLQKASNVRKLIGLARDFSRGRPPALNAFISYLGDLRGQAVDESEAVLHPENRGAVRLLTVHKSKGLEFPVVVLPDMIQAGGGAKSEDLALHRDLGMALRVTGPDGKTAPGLGGQLIAQRRKTEEREEHARLLYVAMTRAQDYLVLCGHDAPPAASWFNPVNRFLELETREHGAILEGEGWRVRVTRNVEMKPAAEKPDEHRRAPDGEMISRRTASGEAVRSGPRTIAISAILDLMAKGVDAEEERETEEAPRRFGRAASAMMRGTLVHRMFELWDFRGDRLPDLAALTARTGFGPAREEEIIADLEVIAARFRESELFTELAAAGALYREAPFLLPIEGALVSGTIDLLTSEGMIVDYKTGVHDEDRDARYEWQLLLYAAAAQRLKGISNPRGYLCYVDEGRLKPVSLTPCEVDLAMRQAGEIILSGRL